MDDRTSQPTTVPDLVERSDFIGFVRAVRFTANPHGVCQQQLEPTPVDALKGQLEHPGLPNRPFVWAISNPTPSWNYPTRCLEPGEYLVFLRRSTKAWTIDAAYRVTYQPNYLGSVSGMVLGENQQALSLTQVRESLVRLIAKKALSPDTNRRLSFLFKRAARPIKPLAHDERLRQTQRLVANIKPGMTRADINKIFPVEDGGLSGASSTRYYVGSEVMVEVPFDDLGGAWKPENRVNGLVRVYKSLMHLD